MHRFVERLVHEIPNFGGHRAKKWHRFQTSELVHALNDIQLYMADASKIEVRARSDARIVKDILVIAASGDLACEGFNGIGVRC
jgi:hypothetical protein